MEVMVMNTLFFFLLLGQTTKTVYSRRRLMVGCQLYGCVVERTTSISRYVQIQVHRFVFVKKKRSDHLHRPDPANHDRASAHALPQSLGVVRLWAMRKKKKGFAPINHYGVYIIDH
ncbi:hypothetical protein BC832DRAFT_300907 [Gaertneriomyces semiglobifer]|nr:hypothetical protein BC832DRAFT_300907 [Gaertneriomyces semiglobifer]